MPTGTIHGDPAALLVIKAAVDRQRALLEHCDRLDAVAAAGVGTLTTDTVRAYLTGAA